VTSAANGTPWIGQSLPRREDARLLQGKGRYLDDLSLPEMSHLQILRSPHPHARILGIASEAARAMPGVIAVVTGDELLEHMDPVPEPKNLPFIKPLPYFPLAIGSVRFEGEPVAAVVAESPELAEDALGAVDVEYEAIPAIATADEAVANGAPLLYEEWGDNVHANRSAVFGDVDGVFAEADHVFDENFHMHRQTALPLELRGTLASFDGDSLDVWSSTQTPHLLRTLIGHVLRFPESRIRVVAPDVGGGFGVKYQLHREELLVPALARLIRRPVKWRESMWEHLASATQSRDKSVRLQLAVRDDGMILGLRADMLIDVGSAMAYPYSYGSTLVLAGGLPLGLKTQNYSYDYRCVVTNKAPSGAYRGFGNNMRVFVIERALDIIASRLEIDRAEIRRRNLVAPGDIPYRSASGVRMRSGSLTEPLEKALGEADYDSLAERKGAALKEGRYLGMGMVAFAETAVPSYFGMIGAFGGEDSCTVRIEPDGSVTALVGTAPQGQGHETAFAQVVADQLGVHPNAVTVRHSDTSSAPYGLGAWGSRSAVVAGGAAIIACGKLRAKLLQIGAHLLDTESSQARWAGGAITHESTGRAIEFAELVDAAYGGRAHLPSDMEPGLEATAFFEPPSIEAAPDAEGKAMRHGTVATQAHVATVDVNPDTGQVSVLDYVVVHDCGVIINPALVDGQIRGGVAQGLAGTLFEEIVYDEDAHLVTGTLLDYQVPTALETPRIRILHLESPDPSVPGGFKGMAEGGTIGAPAAIANAVADALAPLDVRITSTPLTAVRISELIAERRAAGIGEASSTQEGGIA
jgi:aerobic carbon-monoxide dehydrogenase large subunit